MADDPKSPSASHRAGVAADGIYQGVIKMAAGAGIAVDLINSGLKAVGLPMGDKPVGGSTWIKGTLTSAYNSYNNITGYQPPAPVDKTDRIIHATADLAGQVAIPVGAAMNASRSALAVAASTKEVITASTQVIRYGNAVADSTGMADDAARAARSVAATYGIGGDIKTGVPLQAAFTASASGVAAPVMAAVADMKGPVQQQKLSI